MRRHDARKWLHAILDLLPVILIPVFMIYSHRHTIDSYTIDVPQNRVVDFNQQNENGKPTNLEYYSSGHGTISMNNNYIKFVSNGQNLDDKWLGYSFNNSTRKISGDKYYVSFEYQSNYDFSVQHAFLNNISKTNNKYSNVSTCSSVLVNSIDYFYNFDPSVSDWVLSIKNYMMINLTKMFGAGNEPTKEQFETWYTKDYYDYTLSHKELLKGYITTTYNDTDIMSQFTYNLYNSVDKYFNMNNVFGLTSVYDWFNLNIFNGNAPLYIYVVWNIVLYEFVMDLLMLLYALFMWFIDFCQDLIDRCFTTSKGGKH